MAKLDRSRGYGEITGDYTGKKYDQDGAIFNSEGDEWVDPKAAPPAAPAPAADPKGKKADKVVDQLAAQTAE